MPAPSPDSLLSRLNELEALRDPMRSMAAKRQFERFVLRGEAELQPMGRSRLHQGAVTIQMRDLSRGGMGFVCPQPLPLQSQWRVCFFQRGYLVGQQAMVVCHCTSVDSSLYLVGGNFVIDDGLMVLLGIDPAELMGDGASVEPDDDAGSFLPPADVA